MEKKGVVIYQIALPDMIAKIVLEEMLFFSEEMDGVKVEAFFLKEVVEENTKHLSVKITSNTIKKAQRVAIPIFKALSLLELVLETIVVEAHSFYMEIGKNPKVHIGKQNFRYSEVFAKA